MVHITVLFDSLLVQFTSKYLLYRRNIMEEHIVFILQ